MAEDNENRNEAIKECRTCQQPNDEQNMISLCICEGTIKYVYKNCLRQWFGRVVIISRATIAQSAKARKSRVDFVDSLHCRGFEPSLCR
jgi:E3 ubiquitin-protein ligase DOA10